MKHRINKMAAIFIASIFALSGLGITYATWTDTVIIDGTVTTGELKWELVQPISHADFGLDWNCFFDLNGGQWVLMDKDVGSTSAILEAGDHPHVMTVTIDNAYPYYGNHISFVVHNYGSIPLIIWKVDFIVDGEIIETIYAPDQYVYLDLDDDKEDDFEIWWGNSFGDQLHFCQSRDISFKILVLQPAPQNSHLTFDMEYVAIQWNEYTSGP